MARDAGASERRSVEPGTRDTGRLSDPRLDACPTPSDTRRHGFRRLADRQGGSRPVPYEAMKALLVPIVRPIPDVRAPLRRSLPAPNRSANVRKYVPGVLLALAGVALFVNIEFGLAYLLYFASRLG